MASAWKHSSSSRGLAGFLRVSSRQVRHFYFYVRYFECAENHTGMVGTVTYVLGVNGVCVEAQLEVPRTRFWRSLVSFFLRGKFVTSTFMCVTSNALKITQVWSGRLL